MKNLVITNFNEYQEKEIIQILEHENFKVNTTFLQINCKLPAGKKIDIEILAGLFNDLFIPCNLHTF